MLPLLCLKIFWHEHSQQQQWCNLVTSLWHLYSRPKPGSYLPYQRLYIQRGRSPCFSCDCEADKERRGGNSANLPFSQRETPHFFQPCRQRDLRGVIFKISQTKIAARLSTAVARELRNRAANYTEASSSLKNKTKQKKIGTSNAKATAFNVSLPSQLRA